MSPLQFLIDVSLPTSQQKLGGKIPFRLFLVDSLAKIMMTSQNLIFNVMPVSSDKYSTIVSTFNALYMYMIGGR